VISEANKIVPTGAPFVATSGIPHALQADVTTVFPGDASTAETILSMPFTAQNTPGGQSQIAFYYRAPGGVNKGGGEFTINTGAGSINADNVSLVATDARRVNWFYKSAPTETDVYLNKYTGGTPYLDRAPIMRWAEVLLNLSEAIARTSGGVDSRALDLLNAVRTRSAGAANAWAPADNATLIDNIMTERRIEFIGEGLRNQDIMRLLGTFPSKGIIPAVDPTGLEYVWPLPLTEILANHALTQNSPND
jgi:hypothetical protein